jgi:hypothetical protein
MSSSLITRYNEGDRSLVAGIALEAFDTIALFLLATVMTIVEGEGISRVGAAACAIGLLLILPLVIFASVAWGIASIVLMAAGGVLFILTV